MRFSELLRTTVLLSAAAATVLAVVTLVGVNSGDQTRLGIIAIAWWAIAAVIGSRLGRPVATSRSIGTLLANARTQMTLPELNPARVVINRLWPLIVFTVGAGALGLVFAQIPAIAAGFAIIWSLAWRKQASAVSAIEQRDGARFYVERTSPLRPIKLVRTPGFRSNLMELNGVERPTGITR
jgi:hypothetical protein